MDFVTIGMLIIDNIYFPHPRPPALSILGGAGTYAAMGARLIAGTARSKSVGWTVHEGHDFPAEVKEQIESWATSCNFIPTPNRGTTRASNVYRPNGIRDFEYTTPKIRIESSTLTHEQLQARSFHLVCSPKRCIELVQGILGRRNRLFDEGRTIEEPIIVWEPVPDLCIPSEKSNFILAMRYVDVFSPNLEEFAALLDVSFHSPDGSFTEENFDTLATMCRSWLRTSSDSSDAGRLRKSKGPSMIVRMGAYGSWIADEVGFTMIEPYHSSANALGGEHEQTVNLSQKVVDPTGAGNAFLGGFCTGLTLRPVHETKNFGTIDSQYLVATLCGTVAASFAIEQIGLPILSRFESTQSQELWNGDSVTARIQRMVDRTGGIWPSHQWKSPNLESLSLTKLDLERLQVLVKEKKNRVGR